MAKFDKNWWRVRQARAYALRAYDVAAGHDKTWYHGGKSKWKRAAQKTRKGWASWQKFQNSKQAQELLKRSKNVSDNILNWRF